MKSIGLITIIFLVFAMYYHSKEDSQQNRIFPTNQAIFASSISAYQSTSSIKVNSSQSNTATNTEKKNIYKNNTIDFFIDKESKIEKLENGTTKVNISLPNMDGKLEIISTSEIYYPSETDLNYGVRGCSLGGYYVELNADITLIEINENKRIEFHFKCVFSEFNNSHILIKADN